MSQSQQRHTLDAEVMRLTLRRAHAEATPEELQRLDARLAARPELADAVRRLEQSWRQLEAPPTAPAPPGFSTRVVARARALRRGNEGFSWSLAPTWLRAATAAALVGGLALGASVGALVAQPESTESWGLEEQLQVSDSHWAVQDADSSLTPPWSDTESDW